MEKTKIKYALVFAFFLAATATYVFRLGGESYSLLVSFFTFASPLVAIVFGAIAMKHFGLGTTQGKSLVLILLGVISWLVADMIWAFIIGGEVDFSVADIIYILGYLSTIAGIFVGLKTIDSDFFREKKHIAIVMGSIIFLSAAYLYVFPIEWDSQENIMQNLASTFYTLADMLLLGSVVLIISIALKGTYKYGWVFVAAGVIVTAIGDMYYALNFVTYENGDIVDLTWNYGYLFFALSFIAFKHNAEQTLDNMRRMMMAVPAAVQDIKPPATIEPAKPERQKTLARKAKTAKIKKR
ncbi:MAG: hypothetical protein HGA85_04845 [Nanoarchaeota archaeon]|nr:hypothetical protein [Nanoarchaeota archaeon]